MMDNLKNTDPIRIFIIGMSGVVLILGVFLIYLVWDVSRFDEELPRAKGAALRAAENAEELDGLRKLAARNDFLDPNSVGNRYFDDRASQCGVGNISVNPVKSRTGRSAGYKDSEWEIKNIKEVPRSNLAKFIYAVENDSTLLKCQEIRMQIKRKAEPEDDEWDVPTLRFAFRQADTGG